MSDNNQNVVSIEDGSHREIVINRRNEIVETYKSLVPEIALEMLGRAPKACFGLDDLVSAGNQSLIDAALRVAGQPQRTDAEIRSYLHWRIHGAMLNEMRGKNLREVSRPGLEDAPEPRLAPVIEFQIDSRRLLKRVGDAIAQLPERERVILGRYYFGKDEPTFERIGGEIGLSDRRVKQLHDRGIGKLKLRLNQEAVLKEAV